MWFERNLRRVSVGTRTLIAGIVLVLPMTVLITVSVHVLTRQETQLRAAVEEAVQELVPLTTLEYDLQRALTDDLEAQTGQSVPDYGGLTGAIDRLITQLESESANSGIPAASVRAAQKSWASARPVIESLVEHVAPVGRQRETAALQRSRQELTRALKSVEVMRRHLARVINTRTAQTLAAQKREIRRLVWTWTITLAAIFLFGAALIYSIVKPARELGFAVRRLAGGDLDVRVENCGKDELGVVATYLNAMAARFALRKSALESEARQDALTGLPNRRAVEDALEAALVSSGPLGLPVSVLMIDVDRFKEINDRFGHGSGDQALIWLADSMRGCFRGGDVLGRFAGDEFLAVLPETAGEQAQLVAGRLCALIKEQAEKNPQKPSVTIGVATTGPGLATATSLLHAADQALYRAKAEGRARVGVA